MGTDTDLFAVVDPPEERYDHISIYADGVLVGGIEPDGTTVEEKPKETTTTKPKTTTTTTTTVKTTTTTTTTAKDSKTTTTTTSAPAATTAVTETYPNIPGTSPNIPTDATLEGDTNCDGTVDMADAVLIMQALANPNKYGLQGTAEKHLTSQGAANGDVDKTAKGLTSNDALKIQQYLLGIIKSF